jgi:hypothetical protein
VFAVFASDFPRSARPLFAIEDVASTDPKLFGALGAVYLGGAPGLRAYPIADADAETQAMLAHVLTALRQSALAAFDYRDAARTTIESRSAFDRTAARKRAVERTVDSERDTAAALVELVGREAAKAAGAAVRLGDVEADPPPPAAVVSQGG